MDNSQKSHKSKNNAWRTKDLSAGLRTYKNRETCSRWTPVSDGQFSLHQGCPFYKGLTVIKNLNVDKMHGWDNISIRMIKLCGKSLW